MISSCKLSINYFYPALYEGLAFAQSDADPTRIPLLSKFPAIDPIAARPEPAKFANVEVIPCPKSDVNNPEIPPPIKPPIKPVIPGLFLSFPLF